MWRRRRVLFVFVSEGCTANARRSSAALDGSEIEIEPQGPTWMSWTNEVSRLHSVMEPVTHFGLGVTSEVKKIRTHLRDGESQKLADTVQI